MKSRYDALQDPQERRRLALLLASPAAALAALLLAGAFLLGCSEAPAVQADRRPAAQAQAARQDIASKSPDHIVAAEGDVDYREPLKYMGQPAVQ
jgi:PBP1b-binding outer membrane lipoprotein LpoB